MKLSRRTLLAGAFALAAGCKSDGTPAPSPPSPPAPPPPPPPAPPPPPPPPPSVTRLDFNFAAGLEGWEPSFSDYSLGMEASIAFAFGHEPLPSPHSARSGIFLQGHNRSADLFMYMTRLVTGLAPNTRYRVELTAALASDAAPNCVGAGSPPGEGVILKGGATGTKPEKRMAPGNYVTTSFDHGGGLKGGADTAVMGDLAFGAGGCGDADRIYGIATRSTAGGTVIATSDASGRLWLVIGTDSGFEGFTKVYYLEISAILTPV